MGPEKMFYGYFKNLTSKEGVAVSALFKHLHMQGGSGVEIQSLTQNVLIKVYRNGTWDNVISAGALLPAEKVK